MNYVLKNLILLMFLCLMFLHTGCSTLFKKEEPAKPSYTPISQHKMNCVNKLIRLDVKPLEAGEICGNIYQQR